MAPLRVTKWEQYLQEPHLHHCHLLAIASLVAVQQVCISLAWQHGNPGLGGCGTQATVFIGWGGAGRAACLDTEACLANSRTDSFPHLAPKGPGNGIERI